MVLSLSPGPTDISRADEVARDAQMWRISNDVWDGWSFERSQSGSDFPTGIAAAFDNLARWASHARPGHWPDADMLPVGMLAPRPGWGEPRASRLTPDEQQTQFVLWAIARSPLILGSNLTELDELTRSLIPNQRLIEINQGAWTSHPAAALPGGDENIRVWVASPTHSRSGDRIVAVFNLGSQPMTLQASWHSLGSRSPSVAVINLLTGEGIDRSEAVDLRLPAHASAVYRLH
jgi:alpha-galactosidase